MSETFIEGGLYVDGDILETIVHQFGYHVPDHIELKDFMIPASKHPLWHTSFAHLESNSQASPMLSWSLATILFLQCLVMKMNVVKLLIFWTCCLICLEMYNILLIHEQWILRRTLIYTRLALWGKPSQSPPLYPIPSSTSLNIIDTLKSTKCRKMSKSNIASIEFDKIEVQDVTYSLALIF